MTATTTVLLCTYNGGNHLHQQLDSVLNQSIDNINILASDDGSSDNTLAILKKYKLSWTKGYFKILAGPQQGFAENFLSLTSRVKTNSDSDYFAFCDQDDIWKKDKLKRAIKFLKSKEKTPALYCSRTEMINELGTSINQLSPLFKKKPSFANAIVQSIAGGNTMVLNSRALNLIRAARLRKVVSHDWWTYMLVTGAGGSVFYDPEPSLLYRQHANNLIGANGNFSARMKRLRMLIKGEFRDWTSLHIKALQDNQALLNKANKKILENITFSQQESLLKRVSSFKKSNAYRQTMPGNIALWIAVLLKKL